MDNDSSWHAEMYAPGKKRKCHDSSRKRLYVSIPGVKKKNSDTEHIQCITVIIILTVWY